MILSAFSASLRGTLRHEDVGCAWPRWLFYGKGAEDGSFCNQTFLFGVSSVDRLIFMFMQRIVLSLACAAAVLAGAPVVLAAPFNAKDVGAAPALLVHLDCDALRASTVAQAILAQQEVQDKLAALGAIFDFDVTKQLHGLTVYTTEAHPKDGALIVYADFDSNRLITLAKGQDGFQCSTNGTHVVYSWLQDRRKARGGERLRFYGAIAGQRVVFGHVESRVTDALEVMDGAAASFSGKKDLPGANAGESVLLEGVLLKFDFDNANQQAAIFKMSKSMRMKLSEAASNLTATIHLEAADTDTATQIANIGQGLLAMLKLQQADTNAMKLANALQFKQDGPAVDLTLSEPSSEMIEMIKDGQKKAGRKARDAKESAHAPPENN
jgi:hypothetical protein